MFTEDQLRPISGLQHFLFCPRQCYLIHAEQLWAENRLTLEGTHLHKKAHDGPDESRDGRRTVRGMQLRSFQMGLFGVADVVEFPIGFSASGLTPAASPDRCATAHQVDVLPIEYKRGRPKANRCDEVQLCAQAMCLEEMLGISIDHGALYYGKTKRRKNVAFDQALRVLTRQTAAAMHEMLSRSEPAPAVREPKCDKCSLINLCMPGALGRGQATKYMAKMLKERGGP